MGKTDNWECWLWLVNTTKGDFFLTASGPWSQAESAKKVWQVFDTLKIDIVGMIPRKMRTGPDEMGCTIFQSDKPVPPWSFSFLAGKKLWQACGRTAEYDAEMVLLNKETEELHEKAMGHKV